MERFIGWLRRRGAVASALGGAAGFAGAALAGPRDGDRKDDVRRTDRDDRDGGRGQAEDDRNRQSERRSEEKNDGDGGGRERGDRRGVEEANQRADDDGDDDGERAAAAQRTATPTPAATQAPSATAVPTATPGLDGNASIEDEQGNVIVGFDPETGSVIAQSGDVVAISGPGGPRVIIGDDEAVNPVPGDTVTPAPDDGGDNDTGFES